MSTDAEINDGGGAERPRRADAVVQTKVGESALTESAPGALKPDASALAEPTLPRADSADGLAHGSVTDAAVTDAAVEWCPCVNGPSSVRAAVGPQEWVPACLSDVSEGFEVEEELGVLVHSFLAHDAEDHVGL